MSRIKPAHSALLILFVAALLFWALPFSIASGQKSAYANLEPAQTNPIRLSGDGTRLFAANSANDSLSVFDVTKPANPSLLVEIPVGVGPVSVNSRSDDEVWVVNQVSNSVSVVSVSRGIVTDTIKVGSGTEPMDVVFAGASQAYVSCSRANSIAVFDTNTHALIEQIPVFGGSPRALAVSPDGSTVYAAFAIAGNATTLIPPPLSPPQPAPWVPLPKPPHVSVIVSATDPKWQQLITYKMPDNGVVAIAAGAVPSVLRYFSAVGTINLGLAVNPDTGDLFVANTNARNLTFFEPILRGHWIDSRITRIQIANGQVTAFDLNPNINYRILPNLQALRTALSQPSNVVFDPSGNFMYVAAFGTDRVAKVDTSGNVLSFVEVSLPGGSGSNVDPKNKRGPRGLALNATAQTLYSLNRIANTISIINTAKLVKTGEVPVGTDPTPLLVKQGRGFLYDAKLSGNGTGACASCHVDADMDHLAWNLGDPAGQMSYVFQGGTEIAFHPMKGPMVTKTLRGLIFLSPFHWRGDFTTLHDFDVVFDKLMGSSELSDADFSIYETFINSIHYLPNPNENLDRSLPSSLAGGNPINGEIDYMTVKGTGYGRTCDSCHTANPGPGENRLILPGFLPQPLQTPQLRNVYQKQLYTRHNAETIDGFGMEHDGNISAPADLLSQPLFNGYTAQQKTDMTAYLLCFDTGTAPAVGYTITLNAANVTNQQEQTDWATLQSQAQVANIDLIARGTIQGQVNGLLYEPGINAYLSADNQQYTQAQLQTLILNGDTLSFQGVYPGTGVP